MERARTCRSRGGREPIRMAAGRTKLAAVAVAVAEEEAVAVEEAEAEADTVEEEDTTMRRRSLCRAPTGGGIPFRHRNR